MPFSGNAREAHAAVRALATLVLAPGDELILAENSGVAVDSEEVTVVSAGGEQSPARARNAGAAVARGEWLLFLDADCTAPADLLDVYLSPPPPADVGALAGEVVAAPDADTLAARYGAARNFLSQQAHLSHPYMPRAVAANLMVRREAFERLGGFYEGVRAAEDTDFSWRLQHAGWRLELRAQASVEHRYRASLGDLRRQWRGYAAGRAWLGRRYAGFRPEPAIRRAVTRLRPGIPGGRSAPGAGRLADGARGEPRSFLALDALLALDELAGLALSNKPPARSGGGASSATAAYGADSDVVVLIANRFPAPGDPRVDFARTLRAVRVEALARPDVVDVAAAAALRIDYFEDDGFAARLLAALRLLVRHPWRSVRDLSTARDDDLSLSRLAPAAGRLERNPNVRVRALGGTVPHRIASRLAALTGGRLDG